MVAPIPRKATKPSRDTGMLCGLCNKYGGAAKSHITSKYKRWTGSGKDHSKWKWRTASATQLNTHTDGDGIKSVMAQQAKFGAFIIRTVNAREANSPQIYRALIDLLGMTAKVKICTWPKTRT